MKKVIYGIGLAITIVGLAMALHTVYLYQHREFGVADFRHPFILQEERGVQPDEALKSEARQALNQPFVYLGYGGQMTAYQSADGRYVLKFFNPRSAIKEEWFHRWRKLRYINTPQWVLRTHLKKREKLRRYLNRYAMAFRDLREETGLIYVHLDRSTSLSHRIEVIDKDGTRHAIEVDAYPFVLQKRADLIPEYLSRLIQAGEITGAEEAIQHIYSLFLSRATKGYKDKFQHLFKNYGFVEGKAVQFDVGRIEHLQAVEQDPLHEMHRVISHILPAIEESFPQLAPLLVNCLAKDQEKL